MRNGTECGARSRAHHDLGLSPSALPPTSGISLPRSSLPPSPPVPLLRPIQLRPMPTAPAMADDKTTLSAGLGAANIPYLPLCGAHTPAGHVRPGGAETAQEWSACLPSSATCVSSLTPADTQQLSQRTKMTADISRLRPIYGAFLSVTGTAMRMCAEDQTDRSR